MTRSRLTLGELATVWVDEPHAPFQIALAAVFDASPFQCGDGRVDANRIRAELVSRTSRVATLRRRVVWTRPGQGRPYWVDDAAFRAERHVSCTALPKGVTFADWCAQEIVRPLDVDRPLWRATVVSDLPGTRFGMLLVVHHAVAGGLEGVALVAALLDPVPHDGPGPFPPSDPSEAVPVTPAEPATGRARTMPGRLLHDWRQLAEAATDLRGRAPATSLSRPIGAGRRLATVRVPLDGLLEAGHRLGVTVNDVLLAAVTGGLRDLLARRGDDLTGLVLRASVPVGTRARGQPDGMLLVGLPVGEPDALQRLAGIHRSTTTLKARLRAGGGDVLDVLHLPTPLARLAVRGMRSIAGRGINLYVTNVPGPAEPLWLAGARLLEAVPIAPLVRGVPLGIAGLSYAGTLHVSVDADAAVEDLDLLAHGLEASVEALLDAARSGARLPAASAPVGGPGRGGAGRRTRSGRDFRPGAVATTDASLGRPSPHHWRPTMGVPASPVASGRQQGATIAFAPPYERDGTTVITATAARSHTATRGNGAGPHPSGLDAEMSGSRPLGAFVVRGGRVRWHPAVDLTRVITTAEIVVGGVLIARRLAARPSGANAHVTMGPGGWVSMKGGAMAVRPAERGWRRRRTPPTAPARTRRPWWARLLAARTLQSILG